jgi:predicted DsbA family dithiol-disulfide isomerase
MNEINKLERADNPTTVLHWYDFICPFCYVGQHRNEILIRQGFHVQELAFQAHPDIPRGGIPAGPRNAPMYSMLEREAKEAGLALHWPPRLPNSRKALAAAEWVRGHYPSAFLQVHRELFEAHFVLGEDLEDPAVIDLHARRSGVNLPSLHAALDDGSAERLVTETETIGRKHGVQGAPAWLLNRRLTSGLRPTVEFERLAKQLSQVPS